MLDRISENISRFRRQIQAVLETDFVTSVLKNDRVMLSALETLLKGSERDRKRIAVLEEEVRRLREEISGRGPEKQ